MPDRVKALTVEVQEGKEDMSELAGVFMEMLKDWLTWPEAFVLTAAIVGAVVLLLGLIAMLMAIFGVRP